MLKLLEDNMISGLHNVCVGKDLLNLTVFIQELRLTVAK